MRKTTLYRSIPFVAIASGCTDGIAPLEDPALRRSEHVIVHVDTLEPPTLIAYRAEGSATWQTPAQTGPSTFNFAVDGPYRVTVVCDELATGQVTVRQIARTTTDDHALAIRCDTVPSPYLVTGTMAQAGTVRLGTDGALVRSDHSQFALAANRGEHALVAYTNDRIAVRRPFVVTGDTMIAQEIDVAAEGHAFEPVTLVPTNLDGTELVMRSIVWLDIAGTQTFLSRPLAATKVVPNAVLTARDEQTVTITVHSATVGRTVMRPFRAGDPTTFPLPEALGPVEFDELSVAWSTLPAFDVFELSFDAISFETFMFQFLYVQLSQSFIAATGVTSAAIDVADIPGFRSEWLIDTSQEYHRFAGVLQTLPTGDVVGSDVSQVVNGPSTTVEMQFVNSSVARYPARTLAVPDR